MAELYRSEAGRKEVLERYAAQLDNWPVKCERRLVPTRHGETFVLVCGPESAPPLVLIHGSLANCAAWRFDVPVWAQHFRIYAVDIIGEPGLSAPARPPLDAGVYADWLAEVLKGLGLERTAVLGESLGGWMALAHATRYPAAVTRLALLVPGGLSSQFRFFYRILPLLLLGDRGLRKIEERIYGRARPASSGAAREFFAFIAVITKNCRPRMEKLPIFGDEALRRLTMPVFAIFGGREVFFDPEEARRRLEKLLPAVEIDYRPDAPHVIQNRTLPILEFLKK
ncbi:MAG: alpha/beta hydrolase [Elusimicrobia bacterium]|nr:alpha/beta hydrolase [Elusimicrobiota bacterium]